MTNYIRIAGVLALCTVLWVGCQDSTNSDSARKAASKTTKAAGSASTPTFADDDPVYAAIQSAIKDPSVLKRVARLTEILDGAGEEAVPGVLKTLNKFRVDESPAEFAVLFYFWAQQDPAAAADWALTSDKARFKGSAVFTAFEAWGRLDPQAATQGVYRASTETDQISRLAQFGMIHGWYVRDRDELESFIRAKGIGVTRQRAIFGFALSMVSLEGAEAAQEWAESLPDDDVRFKKAAFVQTSNALNILDMPAAVAWCDEQCNGPWGGRIRTSLLRARLREGDPAPEVLAWLSNMPADSDESREEKMASIRLCYSVWAFSDREEALSWLETVIDTEDEPEWLPQLFKHYASQKAIEDPRAAIDFVKNHITEDQERAYVAVGMRWKISDPEAMQEWLDTAPLSAESKRRILNSDFKALVGDQ